MVSNIEKYRSDIEALISRGNNLMRGLYYELREELGDAYKKLSKEQKDRLSKESFSDKYQAWYNESLALIKVLLPDRTEDFISYYKCPKRKTLDYETYTVGDYLIGLGRTNIYGETIVGRIDVRHKFEQQLNIVKSLESRFESSLYDLGQLLQADLFDSEIDSARELCSKGFYRAAGAICGVVLEKHFAEVCKNHKVTFHKKTLHLSDYNDALKDNGIVDIPTWRQIQRLGDIRNLCDHKKEREPQKDEIEELISGSEKFLKTLF